MPSKARKNLRCKLFCRLREELLEREEIEATRQQLQKQKQEGMMKVQMRKGGGALTLGRLDALQYRQESRSKRRVRLRERMDEVEDTDE
jgi:hypothetical protein